MPWQLVWDGALQCNGAASTSGSQNVAIFAVIFVPLGFREIGTSKLSTLEVAAKLGTLNAMIPSLSEVV